jgi:type I restriction enzyme S subunit
VNLPVGVVVRQEGDGRPAPSEDLSAYQAVCQGDLVMNQLGKPHGALGVSRFNGIISPAYFVAHISPEVDGRFIHYLLRTRLYISEYERRGKYQPPNQFDISWNQFREIDIVLPPRQLQTSIANFLDDETARIERLIVRKMRMIELQRERLVTFIGELPGSRKRLKYVLRERNERGHLNEVVLSVYRDLGVIPKDSREDNANETPEDISQYKLVLPGDVVVNKMKAWQGSVAVSPHRGIVSGAYMVCQVTEDINRSFLHYLLRSPKMIGEYAIRSTGIRPNQWNLHWGDFSDIEITIPERVEQDRALSGLGDVATMERLNHLTERQVAFLKERRQALVIAAVTGQLDISGVAA